MSKLIAGLVFILSTALFYMTSFTEGEVDKLFLSITTFLFAIFSGFFISRQGSRYSNIRSSLAKFDGELSALYRAAAVIGGDIQTRVGDAIKKHYKPVVKTGEWDYNVTHKSSTLTDISNVLPDVIGHKKLSGMASAFHAALRIAQEERKVMVALREERIPSFQWLVIYLLTGILLVTFSVTISSEGFLLGSVLKGVFVTAVFSVMMLLKQLDSLKLFEGTIGGHSAQDALSIIGGKR